MKTVTKDRMNITIPADTREALKSMAVADGRSLSSMASLLLARAVTEGKRKKNAQVD